METATLDLVSLPPEPVRRLTVEDYHAMIRAGILTEDDPYELIEGWLVPKMTRNAPHDLCVQRLQRIFTKMLPEAWLCFVQSAVTLVDGEPEPDIAIVNAPDEQYAHHHPFAADIALIVEVADSSLRRDRGSKLRSYARAGIAAYWIVNISAGVLEAYSGPGIDENGEPTYLQRQDFATTDEVPLAIGDRRIGSVKVSGLLP